MVVVLRTDSISQSRLFRVEVDTIVQIRSQLFKADYTQNPVPNMELRQALKLQQTGVEPSTKLLMF